jgi:polyisoprenoid-binding protein YceI
MVSHLAAGRPLMDDGDMVAGIVLALLVTAAQNACVTPGRGFFRVYAEAGGLFSVFAHDHLIEAEKIEGCAAVDLQNPAQSSVKLSFAAGGLRVVDPKESAEDRAKVQKTMETDVLRISEFPMITFESTGVTGESAGKFRVNGRLTIRGKTSPVVIPVTVLRLEDGTYRVTGTYKFKQTTFGIEPIRLMGGTVRVKDEVRTEWELYLK